MGPEQKTIAIVEDDPTVREALGELLSMLGYRTDLFTSAEEFLLAGPTIDPSCLILDIQLGDITGIELARQLAAEGLTVPVIFMTGSNDPTFRRQALDFGCVAYLQKPFPARQLIEAVKAASGEGPAHSSH